MKQRSILEGNQSIRFFKMDEGDPLLRLTDTKHQNCYEKTKTFTRATLVGLFLGAICFYFLSETIDASFVESDSCQIELVESIPEGLKFNTSLGHTRTYNAWSTLISLATKEIKLAGMYWTLRGQDFYSDPSDWEGETIYKQIENATREKKLQLRIAQNLPPEKEPNLDTEDLQKNVGAEVRSLNFKNLMGAGVLHTKLWIVDDRHFYVGSANFDWRSLTQVKELGVLVRNCPCLANDMAKIWQVYWDLGKMESVPVSWPDSYSTKFNSDSPLQFENSSLTAYLSSSPAPFCPSGREVDIDAIVKTIGAADKFIYIAVMDYFPTTIYTSHQLFWPVIDDALRTAAINKGVKVRLLVSNWAHTRPSIHRYLKSLTSLTGDDPNVDIQVKMFTVPSFTPEQEKIPFARVNHNKYMVTDKHAYIGTSNWSGDYFISTGGIGLILTEKLRDQLEDVFHRDWSSAYADHSIENARKPTSNILYNHYEL